jgi:hypothetical protein
MLSNIFKAAKVGWYPAGEIATGIGKDGKGGCFKKFGKY